MAEDYRGKQIYELFETSKLDLNSALIINTSTRETKRISFKAFINNLKGDGTDPSNSFYTKDDTDILLSGMRNTLNQNIRSFSQTIEEIRTSYDDITKNVSLISTQVNTKLDSFSTQIENNNSEVTSVRNYVTQIVEKSNDTYSKKEIDQLFTTINSKLSGLYTTTQVDNIVNPLKTQIEILQKKITNIENTSTGSSSGSSSSSGGTAEGLSINYINSGSINLNSYTTAKIFYISSAVSMINAPNNCKDGWLIVLPNQGTGETSTGSIYVKQIFLKSGTVNTDDYEIYVRTRINSTSSFSKWTKMITAKDIIVGSEIPTTLEEGQIYLQYF